ncbi:MAG: (Fe-S)-binding protein [Nitrosomonadaceae bacterium]
MLEGTNRCVSCGLCLPHCPTYRITLSEADSPRGRIALMSGVASGRIPMNSRFVQHMDRCLTCRSCETVCPSHVAYGQLINKTRAMIATSPFSQLKGKTTIQKSWLRLLVERELIVKPTRFDTLRSLLRFYQKLGLQGLLNKSSLLKKTKLATLNTQLPHIYMPRTSSSKTDVAKSWNKIYFPIGKPCGEVGLFLGCVARLADAATLNASIYVLNRLGYTVHVPPTQTCCGALHQHGGDTKTAAQLAKQNIAAFDGLNLHAIITTASGCGAQLVEYHSDFSTKVVDISKFLATTDGWGDIKITPLQDKIVVHDPCTLHNVLHSSKYPYTLLTRIPKARVTPLAGNDQCCGAAGTYFLDQPVMAKALLDDKITALNNSDARFLVTSNVGCTMHISSALRNTNPEIEVLHPVTLLARQMNMLS